LILVDTNILIDITTRDIVRSPRSARAVSRWLELGPCLINAVVYAEFSVGFDTDAACTRMCGDIGVTLAEMPTQALFLAGRAFTAYRRRGGLRTSPLPDFFIGAHAAALGAALLTRDAGRYRAAFPDLQLIEP
jgi:predicted nucleic acid-binding protein